MDREVEVEERCRKLDVDEEAEEGTKVKRVEEEQGEGLEDRSRGEESTLLARDKRKWKRGRRG